MKVFFVLTLTAMSLITNIALAQKSSAKPFQAGKPLGAVNEAGKFVPLSDNVKVYGSFRFAESCVYDATRDLIVVMNAGVPQTQDENDGYVSLLNPDGSVHTTKWIGATRDGLTLNHPLGSAIHNGTLYTADIDVVRTFDLATGKPGKAYPVEGSTFLNGIAVNKEGTIFVSNSRPEFRVYKITADGKVSLFVDGDPLNIPNGVAIDPDGNVVVVNVGNNDVMTFDPANGKLIRTEHAAEGGNDGLVILPDGTKYVSSVRFGSVSKISPGKPAEVIASGIPSAASMGYDSKHKQLIIPMNNNNAVAFLKLED
ncbi:SMP-30/gluconolactonase/LRE family protein [Gimesia maris]|uniref:Serine/threonine-protein kinase PknD n=1 Tax=Gimesia maris TaxID=122 RepID=A0ABX5YK06_9PLAN|nr:SMP-30/gluconolactonase/LRE family protein [Gimesia maris]EDL61138.1 periplasmic ATP/GTP-binding protein [Gimesia maris DSM 8797]QDU14029.1 Serine/threonine-protein kinase PknD [Gimesia maris]QEG15998.1 Serine/threonine-protein kinase PknD [Gimesia maris]QGQ30745.1 gluconolaconase [Gimesia maris]